MSNQAASQIPKGKIPVSELTVKLANPTQSLALSRAIADHARWAGDLSFEDFCKLDERTHKDGAWAQDDGALVWVLVRRDDAEGEVYVACETHRTACFIRASNSAQVEEGWCYGVTTVISPAQHRGKGYGKHFMRLLHYIFASPDHLPPFPAEWGSPPAPLDPEIRKAMPYAACSLLVSEVGPDFYTNCTRGLTKPGWIARPEDQNCLIWDLHKPSSPVSDWKNFSGGWRALYPEDEARVSAALSASARDRLGKMPESERVRILPDPASPGILTFAHRFGSFMPSPEWYSTIDPMPIGLQLSTQSGRVATVLVAMWNFQLGKYFNITLMHNVLAKDVPGLLEALDQLASRSEYTQAWAWGKSPDDPMVKAFRDAPERNTQVTQREGSNLLADVVYVGEGEIIDKQLWTWL